MAVNDIFLKIEQIKDYSPVEPQEKTALPIEYRRDCMRNQGHESRLTGWAGHYALFIKQPHEDTLF